MSHCVISITRIIMLKIIEAAQVCCMQLKRNMGPVDQVFRAAMGVALIYPGPVSRIFTTGFMSGVLLGRVALLAICFSGLWLLPHVSHGRPLYLQSAQVADISDRAVTKDPGYPVFFCPVPACGSYPITACIMTGLFCHFIPGTGARSSFLPPLIHKNGDGKAAEQTRQRNDRTVLPFHWCY